MITNSWYAAGFTADFPRGRLRAPTVAGHPLVLWRNRDGRVVAFDDRGRCVSAPAKGSQGPPSNAALRPYPVTEKDGLVWVWPGNPDRAATTGVPDTPELARPWRETRPSRPFGTRRATGCPE